MTFHPAQQNQALRKLQNTFPLVERPFAAVADAIGVSEEDLLKWVSDQLHSGLIRRFGASFNSRAMGYTSVLIATAVWPEKLETVATFINRNPGVTHNYERFHQFNLWFTLTALSETSIDLFLQEVRAQQGVTDLLKLPALQYYKLNVALDPETGENRALDRSNPVPVSIQSFSPKEKALIRLLQKQMPLCSRPFQKIGQLAGFSESEVLGLISHWKKTGVLRKLGLVLNHRRAGVTANALVVWRVPERKSREIGEKMASFPQVSHCYRRLTYPHWPYSHYTMIHAGTEQKLEAVIQAISGETDLRDFVVLKSGREFKKVGMRYFEEETSLSSVGVG